MNNGEFQAHTQKLDQLVQRVSALPDENARTIAIELLQSLMDLHGTVMTRIVELLSESGESGRTSLAKLGGEPLVCGLLVLYGIHPIPMQERIRAAIEKLRPQLHKQDATVEILGITDTAVRVKIQSGENPSSPEKLKTVVEQAILEAAPEVAEIITEGLPLSNFVPVNMIQPASREEKTYEESAA